MTHPRVLFAMAGGEKGGAERFFVRLILALHEQGVPLAVAVRPLPKLLAPLRKAGVRMHFFPFAAPWIDYWTPIGLHRLVKQFRPQILISFMNLGTSRSPTPRGKNFIKVGRLGGYYDLKFYKGCDYLIGNTPDIVRHCQQGGWHPDKTFFLPNFIDEVPPPPPLPREELDTPQGVPLLVALGRLHPDKDFPTLLRALAFLPKAFLWIVGDGPLKKALQAQAQALGIAGRVRFTGWRKDIAEILAAADVFVSSAREEPFGNACMEAMAAQKPLVCASAQGPAWLLKDGENGLLVPCEQPEALANAIQRVLQDSTLARKLGKNAYRTWEEGFSKKACVRKYLEFFAGSACGH